MERILKAIWYVIKAISVIVMLFILSLLTFNKSLYDSVEGLMMNAVKLLNTMFSYFIWRWIGTYIRSFPFIALISFSVYGSWYLLTEQATQFSAGSAISLFVLLFFALDSVNSIHSIINPSFEEGVSQTIRLLRKMGREQAEELLGSIERDE